MNRRVSSSTTSYHFALCSASLGGFAVHRLLAHAGKVHPSTLLDHSLWATTQKTGGVWRVQLYPKFQDIPQALKPKAVVAVEWAKGLAPESVEMKFLLMNSGLPWHRAAITGGIVALCVLFGTLAILSR